MKKSPVKNRFLHHHRDLYTNRDAYRVFAFVSDGIGQLGDLKLKKICSTKKLNDIIDHLLKLNFIKKEKGYLVLDKDGFYVNYLRFLDNRGQSMSDVVWLVDLKEMKKTLFTKRFYQNQRKIILFLQFNRASRFQPMIQTFGELYSNLFILSIAKEKAIDRLYPFQKMTPDFYYVA